MARNPEQTRQLIIEKALPIFNTKGYNAASISDITSATGITKGAIYGNFKNKDEVATAAFELGVEIVATAIAKRVRAQQTAPDKLRAIMDFYEEYLKEPPIPGGCPVLNSSIEADDNLPFLRSRVIRSIALLKDSVMKIINRGILEGQVKRDVDVEEFTNFFYSTIEGAISVSRIEGDTRSYDFVKRFVQKQINEISI
ncbi:TetR/AcrR family transcriptional regulator [Ekhidna sp.]|uniref:TetR/AcrR family transcriptional regulator n=1 Tax=Ekhidna sp. TaxID=2608089 RepID=UPI0032EC2796